MSSLPPSSTPPEGDDSAPVSLPAADAARESQPVAVAAAEPSLAEETSPAAASVAAVAEAQPGDPALESEPAGQGPQPALEDAGPQLKKLYPALFSNPPKPLKLRIQADIQRQIGTAARTAFGFLGRRCDRVVANVLRRLRDDDGAGHGWN